MKSSPGASFASQESRSISHEQRGGLALPAPAPAYKRPLQMVGKAKTVLSDPATASPDVPELPKDVADEIIAAKSATEDITTVRQAALESLFNHLKTQGAIEVPDGTTVRYVATNNAAGKLADTGVMSNSKGELDEAAKIEVRVFRNGFMAPLAALYSTFRHELIHAGQNSLVPDGPDRDAKGKIVKNKNVRPSAADEYIHVDNYDPEFGAPTAKDMQLYMQEIETHVWEIENRARTGIDKQGLETYLKETYDFLKDYSTKLAGSIKAHPPEVAQHWQNYIGKCTGMMRGLNDADITQIADQIDVALADQLKALKKSNPLKGPSGIQKPPHKFKAQVRTSIASKKNQIP